MPRHSLKSLRQSLSNQLKKEEPNFDEILRLANEIGRADPNFVRFSTDAAIISRLSSSPSIALRLYHDAAFVPAF